MCMVNLASNRRTILAVKGHIKYASPKLFSHLSLQLQAFNHPRLDTAVVVADRQHARCTLRAEKNFARAFNPHNYYSGGSTSPHGASRCFGRACAAHSHVLVLQQVGYAGLLVLQFFQRNVDSLLRKRVHVQVGNDFVFATFASHGKTEHRVLRDAVLAI